jgi:O-antigen/teichoic acid export membrane protein
MFIGIFMLPFYLNHLGAEEYGLVGFFTVLTSIMMLLDMGLSNTLAREASRLKDKGNGFQELLNVLRSVEYIIFIIALTICISIFFSSNWISTNWLQIETLNLNVVTQCVQLMGFMIFTRWFVSLHQGIVSGLEDQVWLNIFKILINTLKFVGGLILVIFISQEIFHFFIFQALIAILEFIVIRQRTYANFNKLRATPSLAEIKRIMPFALSIAYTSLIWMISSQFDKFLLSHYIPLKEYGYFALVVAIQGAVMQFSSPISRAILPRMVSQLSNNRKEEMVNLYRKSTQLISIIIFSIVAIIAFYSYELLYSWTGNKEASLWASPILFWYVVGNAVVALKAFQYNMQYVYGDMKYQNISNTIYPLVSLPLIYFSVLYYGALGSGISWFILNTISFFVLSYLVHNKFVPGLHVKWLIKDILPVFVTTSIFLFILFLLSFNLDHFNRFEIFVTLILIGFTLLTLNLLSYKFTREKLISLLFQRLRKVTS